MDIIDYIKSWVNDEKLTDLVIANPEKHPNIVNAAYAVMRYERNLNK